VQAARRGVAQLVAALRAADGARLRRRGGVAALPVDPPGRRAPDCPDGRAARGARPREGRTAKPAQAPLPLQRRARGLAQRYQPALFPSHYFQAHEYTISTKLSINQTMGNRKEYEILKTFKNTDIKKS